MSGKTLFCLIFLALQSTFSLSFAAIIGATNHRAHRTRSLPPRSLLGGSSQKRATSDQNIYDFSWIKTYYAIGDSYAAGIGAGDALNGPGDSGCSRYNQAYPVQLNSGLETSKFNFLACSGAKATELKDSQIKNIPDNSADLITVSAGGNDVGFENILRNCVYTTTTQKACDTALDDGENAVKKLRNDVDTMLQDLSPKLTQNGVIIYTLYAKFWNDEENYCDKQTWAYWDPAGTGIVGLKLSHQNRQAMNKLTDDVNTALNSAIASARSSTREPIPVYAAAWDDSVGAVKGRFCEEAAAQSPDGNDKVLMFIRKNGISYNGKRRRGLPSPQLPKLDAPVAARALAADISIRAAQETRATPDKIARVFHPSELGHFTITGPCVALIVFHRAKVLKVDPVHPPASCDHPDLPGGGDPSDGPPSDGSPACYSMESGQWKPTDKWVSQAAAAAAAKEYCSNGKQASGADEGDLEAGKIWHAQNFYPGTVNELQLKITFYKNLKLDPPTCTKEFLQIVNGCDVPHDDVNKANLKYGGTIAYEKGKDGGAILEFNPNGHGVGRAPQQFCNDDDTKTFMDPTVLDSNTRDFCDWVSTAPTSDLNTKGPSQPSKTYNDGSVNKVILSAKWPLGGFRPTVDQCHDAMFPLGGGCNIPSAESNPSNKKHGGQMVLDTEYFFQVAPQTNNTVTDGNVGGATGIIVAAKTSQGDRGKNNKLIDKPTLQDCLRKYSEGHWVDTDCSGMVTFYMHRQSSWHSAKDCYKWCSNKVSQQIDQGMKTTECSAHAGFTSCWLGYNLDAPDN
ncbi:MAG: hypothetical protein Q9160_003108 [Pyrenula sp. 1 TL-2023]